MLYSLSKIAIFLLSIFTCCSTLSAQGCNDEKSDTSYKKIHIHLHPSSLNQVTKWDNVDTLFPGLNSEQRYKYIVAIDLKNTETLFLYSLNKLLCCLTKKQKIVSRIVMLTIKNGTSFRFNKIREGLVNLAQINPDMELEYIHSGVQTPASPQKALRSLADERQTYLREDGVYFRLPPRKEHIDKKFFSQFEKEERHYDENQRVQLLKKAFLDVVDRNSFGDWPPFNLTKSDQIIEVYGEDLSTFKLVSAEKPIFAIISGMRKFYMKDLCHLCDAYSSIKGLKFLDSAMNVSDLEDILPYIGMGGQLLMVDVSEAFEELGNDDVYKSVFKYLKKEEKEDLINFFSFYEFSVNSTKHQKLMTTINEYVNFLRFGDDE